MTVRTLTAGTGVTVSNGDGVSGNPTVSLPNVGTAGTYQAVTTDAQGRVTGGSNPTTLAGYGITDAQPLDNDLTAISALGSTGLIARTGAGTVATRTITAGTGMTVTNGSGAAGNPTLDITNTGVTAGTYGDVSNVPQITVNAQGQITGVTEIPVIGSEWTELHNPSDITNSSNVTLVSVTPLNFSVVAGRFYRIEYIIMFRSTAGGTGVGFTIANLNTAAGTFSFNVQTPVAGDGTAATYSGTINAFNDLVLSTAVPTANANFIANINGVFAASASGDIALQFRSETNGQTITVAAGSNGISREFT
jgi:hypothetical protein